MILTVSLLVLNREFDNYDFMHIWELVIFRIVSVPSIQRIMLRHFCSIINVFPYFGRNKTKQKCRIEKKKERKTLLKRKYVLFFVNLKFDQEYQLRYCQV